MLVLRRMDRSPCVRLNFLLRVAFCGWRDGSRRWLEARRLAWRRGDLARFHARKWGVLALATAFFVWRHIHRAFALRQKEKAEYVRLSFADYTIDSELLSRKHELWRAYDSGQLDKIEQQDVHNVITIQRVAAFKAGLLMAQNLRLMSLRSMMRSMMSLQLSKLTGHGLGRMSVIFLGGALIAGGAN